jgi:ribosomal protein S18 acetylase RimI-like enzyme
MLKNKTMADLRAAKHEDLVKIAKCHQKAFPKSLSSAMGVTYLAKMLEWYLVDDRAFIFLLEEDGICTGYCGGMKSESTGRAGSASSMIQHSYNQAVKTFLIRPWLFFHPEFLTKYKLAFRNILKRIKSILGIEVKVKNLSSITTEPHTGLVVIGVDPNVQGKGYGSQLLQEFERVSKNLGFDKMMLTVRTDNSIAIKSYERNGWSITKIEGASTSMEKQLI